MRRVLLLALLLMAAALAGKLGAQRNAGSKSAILHSKHDFRARSAAAIHSANGKDACVFCHTPHNAAANSGYLWNQRLSQRDLPAYSSSTMQASVTAIRPQEVSKLCLSCHDGTIALGDTVNDGLIPFVQGAGYTLPASSRSNLGGNQSFTGHHPFGFAPQPGPEMQAPPPYDAVRLDSSGKIQCTTCHDPHNERIDPTAGMFLVKSNESSRLCITCHQKSGWMDSAHRQPADLDADLKYTSNQGAHTGYLGVSKNGCETCHRPHAPETSARLVKFTEEGTCFQCHDGSVAGRNIKTEFLSKTYKHPVMITPSVHDAAENPNSPSHPLPETAAGSLRHSECVDCHNPHFANGRAAQAPAVSGALLGASGQSAGNAYLPRAANEYEVCFKCHGDSANRPQILDRGDAGIGFGRNPQRQRDLAFDATNVRLQFTQSVSAHPVTRAVNASLAEVPSLRPSMVTPAGAPISTRPLFSGTLIYCTDCHNSDSGRNLQDSSSGPRGPHASNIQHLLERENSLEAPPIRPGLTASGIPYSRANYALCDKCHDLDRSILQDRSFPKHQEHIRQQSAACSTCHDPHAASAPMLVSFDSSIVGPSSDGRLQFTRLGPGHGSCSLLCHGKDHKGERY